MKKIFVLVSVFAIGLLIQKPVNAQNNVVPTKMDGIYKKDAGGRLGGRSAGHVFRAGVHARTHGVGGRADRTVRDHP